MRSFALLYLAVTASIALAIPAPFPQDMEDIVGSLPEDSATELGPGPGPAAAAAPAPAEGEIIADVVEQITDTSAAKRDLEKRYTTLSLPSGWFFAYQNLNAATEHSSYKTYKSLPADTPDVAQACTDFCDSKTGCTFCNVYTEKFGPNPEDEVIKCSLYSLTSGPDQATNDGQWRNGYRVTISKSWAFSKTFTPAVVGWTPEPLDGAINGKRANPTDPDPYMGFASIEASDPSLCAAACDEKTAYNSRHPSGGIYRACNFFNFYTLVKNGVAFKTICSFYLIPFDNSFANNHGYTSGADVYTIQNSWGYAKNVLVGTNGIVTV